MLFDISFEDFKKQEYYFEAQKIFERYIIQTMLLFVSFTKLESPKKKRPVKLTLNVLQNANITYDTDDIYSENSASQIFIQTKETEDSSKRKIKKNIYPESQISKKKQSEL
jgi:hypothetical protein